MEAATVILGNGIIGHKKNISILAAAVNSQFIHSSLAPWYLKASIAGKYSIAVREYTINDRQDSVLSDIYRLKPDVIAFSCYIWNIVYIRSLIGAISGILPDAVVILGGPEVSFDDECRLKEPQGADFVIRGEGEDVFRRLIDNISGDIAATGFRKADWLCCKDFDDVSPSAQNLSADAGLRGVVSKFCGNDSNTDYINYVNYIDDLDSIPSPYTDEMLKAASGRILYYESSRGCPFSCSYCLSSVSSGVRYFNIERVEAELTRLIAAGAGQVKFVDRTFNTDRDRAERILKHIISNARDTSFHLEISAEILDGGLIKLLREAPEGLIQLEAGVQTTSAASLKAVGRTMRRGSFNNNIAAIREGRNVHIHLDLIAGLPEETPVSFAASFNDVYAMKPDNMQLGFLKMLKGTKIRAEADRYGYIYKPDPPYEILSSGTIDYSDILELKDIEAVLGRYYNSRRFEKSIAYLITQSSISPYEFYRKLAAFCRLGGYLDRPVQSRQNYCILHEFAITGCSPGLGGAEGGSDSSNGSSSNGSSSMDIFNELLKFDFFASDDSRNPPSCIIRLEGRHVVKQPGRSHIEPFAYDVLSPSPGKAETWILFDYSCAKSKVTGLYKAEKVQIPCIKLPI